MTGPWGRRRSVPVGVALLIVIGAPACATGPRPGDVGSRARVGPTPASGPPIAGEAVVTVSPILLPVAGDDDPAQEPVSVPGPNFGQDFTRPLTRADLSLAYTRLDGDSIRWTGDLRVDIAMELRDDWVAAFRADQQVVYSDAPSRDNPRGANKLGTGDLYLELTWIAPTGNPGFAWGFGLAAVVPWASQDNLGRNRYLVAPVVGARQSLEIGTGSFVAPVVRWFRSVGSNGRRDDIDELQIQPTVTVGFDERWFASLWSEHPLVLNLQDEPGREKGDWFVPLDIELGHMLTPDVVLSLGYARALVDDDPVFDDSVRLRLAVFF